MKRVWIVGTVVAAHAAVVGTLCMQGCGTPSAPAPLGEPAVVMPPAEPMEQPVEFPVVQPAAKPLTPPPIAPPVAHEPAPAADVTTEYTVAPGDSLSLIAQRFGVTSKQVAALNRITDPNKVRVGQRLLLPGKVDLSRPMPEKPKAKAAKPKPVDAAEPAAAAPAAAANDEGVYVIKNGDSLSTIAASLGVTTKALMEANKISDPNRIVAGRRLTVPAGAKPAAVAAPGEANAAEAPDAPAAAMPDREPAPAPVNEDVEDALPAAPPAAPALGEEPPAAPKAAPAAGNSTSYRIHEVKEDEDVRIVAMQWGISSARLMEANGLTSQQLTPGQRLRIPND